MKTTTLKNTVSILACAISISACSMKDRSEVHSVSVQLPSQMQSTSHMNVLNNHSSSMSISYSSPVSISSFQCFGLNVKGPGINPDPRMGCTNPNSGMGILAGFIPFSNTATLDVMVPAGPARTVELIAIQSDIGCPILEALLANGGVQALKDMGQPYRLGSATTDLFKDESVSIVASFDPNAKAFEGCGGGDDNNEMSLKLQVSANAALIQANHCSSIGIYTNYAANPRPYVMPLVTVPSTGSEDFYLDPSCMSPVTVHEEMPEPFPGSTNSSMMYFFESTGNVGDTFTAKVDTLASGWSTPTVTYTLVADRLQLTGPMSSVLTGECDLIEIDKFDSSQSYANIGDVSLYVYNDSDNAISGIQVFNDMTDCGNDASPVPYSVIDGYKVFELNTVDNTTLAGTGGFVAVKNPNHERVFISAKKPDNSAEPHGTSVQFTAFLVGSMINSDYQKDRTTTHTLTIPIDDYALGTSITGIMLGDTVCGSFVDNLPSDVQCTVPTHAISEEVPIKLIVSGTVNGTYETEYLYWFAGPPSIYAAQEYNFILGDFDSNEVLYYSPEFSTCSGTQPAGLSWSSGCMLEGIATGAGTYNFAVNATNSFGMSVSEFVTVNVVSIPPVFLADPYFCQSGCSSAVGDVFTVDQVNVQMTAEMTGASITSCTITSGSLPSGMSLNAGNCAIDGTPTVPGTYNITVEATNAYYSPVSRPITINVNP
jgi:hypothetical protein